MGLPQRAAFLGRLYVVRISLFSSPLSVCLHTVTCMPNVVSRYSPQGPCILDKYLVIIDVSFSG